MLIFFHTHYVLFKNVVFREGKIVDFGAMLTILIGTNEISIYAMFLKFAKIFPHLKITAIQKYIFHKKKK